MATLKPNNLAMQTIFLVVGGRIKTAQARIVGKIAEVQTPYGIREFGTWFDAYDQAKLAKDRKALKKALVGNAKVSDAGTEFAGLTG